MSDLKILNPEKKLGEISKVVSLIEKEASKIKVTNEKEVTVATEILSKIKGRLKRIEELRKEYTAPLNDVVKKFNAQFKEQSEPLEKAEAIIKRQISDYALEQDRKAREEEKIAEEKRKKELEKEQAKENKKAEKEGREAEQVIDLAPAPVIERRETTTKTESGKTTTKKVWKHEIIDINEIPLKYRKEILKLAVEKGIADTVIRKFVQVGDRDIKGVRIYEDVEVSVTAK